MGTGLIPRDFGGVVRVEIDEAWYDLRRYLGWYDRERLSKLHATTLLMLLGNVKVGDAYVPITDAGRIPAAFGNMVEVDLQRLLTYISAWSHTDERGQVLPITADIAKRLTKKHKETLLARIAELEEEQDGPGQTSPLDVSSSDSSTASSTRSEPASG